MKRFLFAASISFLPTIPVAGQHMYMRKIIPDNGPMAHEVYNVFQDSKHYMWFASDGGVWRYDGKNYKSFTPANGMPDNVIFGFVEDRQKRLWLKTHTNKLAYINNDKITILPCSQKLSETLKSQIISCMHIEADGTIYQSFFRSNSIVKIIPPYKNENISLISIPTKTSHYLYKTPDGTILSGSAFYDNNHIPVFGIAIYPGENNQLLTFGPTFYDTPRNVSKKQSDGSYLIGASTELLEYKNNQLHHLKSFDSPILNAIYDNKKNLWVLTTNEGLLFYPASTGHTTQFTFLKKLLPTSITQDDEGSYWMTTMRNGMFYAPHSDVELLNSDNGLFNGITGSYYDKHRGNILCFQGAALYTIKNNGSVEKNSDGVGEFSNEFYKIIPVSKNILLFAGLHSTLFDLEKKKIIPIYASNALGSSVKYPSFSAAMTTDSLIYAVSQQSIMRFDPSVNFVTIIDTLDVRIRGIFKYDDENVLMNTDRDLTLYNLKKKSHKIISALPENTGIIGVVQSALFPSSFVVVTKPGEIYVLDKKLKLKQKNTSLTGLAVKHVAVDPQGLIWLATNKGIIKINQSLGVTVIDKFHGLPCELVNHVEFGNGKVYASTEDGMVIFPIKKSFVSLKKPDLYLTGIMVNGALSKTTSHYTLNYDQNYLKVNFQGLNFMANGNLTYWYKMNGLDNAWHSTTNNNVEFSALPPGNYTFTLYAKNFDGVKSSQTLQIGFVIYPPFWKTWWFIISCSVLAAVTVAFVFMLRIKQIKKREYEKNELMRKIGQTEMQALRSQMNPHFIFNSMNSIQHYVLTNDPLNANKYLSRFSKLMRTILEQSRQEQVTLQEELDTIGLYLEIESLRFEDNLVYSIDVHPLINPGKIYIPPMIIQPYIENALWHGLMMKQDDQKLDIKFYAKENYLYVEIEDNGIGRKAAAENNEHVKKTRESLGMKITQERLDLMENIHKVKAETIIVDKFAHDNTASGTKAVIKIPILNQNPL